MIFYFWPRFLVIQKSTMNVRYWLFPSTIHCFLQCILTTNPEISQDWRSGKSYKRLNSIFCRFGEWSVFGFFIPYSIRIFTWYIGLCGDLARLLKIGDPRDLTRGWIRPFVKIEEQMISFRCAIGYRNCTIWDPQNKKSPVILNF